MLYGARTFDLDACIAGWSFGLVDDIGGTGTGCTCGSGPGSGHKYGTCDQYRSGRKHDGSRKCGSGESIVLFNLCSGGVIGSRARLRGVWSNPWGFESPPEHHSKTGFQPVFLFGT